MCEEHKVDCRRNARENLWERTVERVGSGRCMHAAEVKRLGRAAVEQHTHLIDLDQVRKCLGLLDAGVRLALARDVRPRERRELEHSKLVTGLLN